MKLVSIAIVNWNGAKFIVRCIRSIFEQAHKAVEVIVVDNASTDGSAELVEKEFGDKVRVVRNENVGYAGGANLAISLAKGDFIIIANSDIVFGDTYIDRCIEALEADPKAGTVSGKLLRYDFDADSIVPVIDSAGIAMNCLRETNDIGQNEPDKGQYEFDMQVFGVCGVAAVFKREVLEAVRLSTGEYYDPDFFTYKEDVDMSWRLNLYGFKCLYRHDAVAYHGRQIKEAKGMRAVFRARRAMSPFIKGISFRNQFFMLMKNETPYMRFRYFPGLVLGVAKYLIWYSLFDHSIGTMKYLREIWRARALMRQKHREIMAHVAISHAQQRAFFTLGKFR